MYAAAIASPLAVPAAALTPGSISLSFSSQDVCYKVRLDNGLYKEAVPEDEISGQVTSDMGDLFGEW